MKLLLENWKNYLEEAAQEDLSKMGVYLSEPFIIIYDYLGVVGKVRYLDDQIDRFIVGAARLGWRDGHFVVEEIFANKGFGPALYKLALEQAREYGLSPSLIKGQVSDQASSVWKQFYDGLGKDDVEHKPLEDKVHGKEHLDSLYFLKPGREIDSKQAVKNHNKIFNERKDPYEEKITHLMEAADSILRDKVAS